ncbi:type II toxin-antitoxin system Phd/YefM family antitoxin [Mycolicibacterium sp. jd]|uniref:type II toxin-antitoxin system Phd/YefM family antitoxin n=1 Tax=unclassified Mycolicibacterium TaxID=2636767 RepID=UPI00351B218B
MPRRLGGRAARGIASNLLRLLMIDPSLPRIGLTELRRQFGRILDEVALGQTFVITRRGREIAVLLPVEECRRINSSG